MSPGPEVASPTEAEIAEIVRGFLVQQARAATDEHRPLKRGTHAKGVCVSAVFEVLDVTAGRAPELAARLARGPFATPAVYPARVRFANSDPWVNSDWEPDVRALSFTVALSPPGRSETGALVARQDFSLQGAPTLPFNDVNAFVVYAKVAGAPNETTALGALPYPDQQVYVQTKLAVLTQKRGAIRPYQQLRYWSNVPFRYGPGDVVKHSLIPTPGNMTRALSLENANALRDEMVRHVSEDTQMASWDFAVQFLDTARMTWQGRHHDARFWIENASVEWPEEQAPFHTVARLTLVAASLLAAEECEALGFDVTGNSVAALAPVGSINRARWYVEVASQQARERRQT